MSTVTTTSRDWVPFKKRTIGKGRGFMTPHNETLKVMFLGNNMYMSKKVLRTLGNPSHINLSNPINEDICLLPFFNEENGYKIHGINTGGSGTSPYADLRAYVGEYKIRSGLYSCHMEDGNLVFNRLDFIPVERKPRRSK